MTTRSGDSAPKRAARADADSYESSFAKGYWGTNPVADIIPNEEYALTTGPDGVPLHVEMAAAASALGAGSDTPE